MFAILLLPRSSSILSLLVYDLVSGDIPHSVSNIALSSSLAYLCMKRTISFRVECHCKNDMTEIKFIRADCQVGANFQFTP